ncbi:PREDICTED: glucose-6-phosphate exchanger SLC37A2-like [Amphimedon queenslandica]|uniref:Major facilitator superfamily (MFS) profile domain-containing protein n=1 Tax=Amphimedon queenslandica TaxID=400682 RepID=A0A1X7URG0_AMPQE|nr:PREDICTED: glucose-6-phosphate exchanger SLC37A2-like [Amphimedon queenslandica]|eukprot:XP_019852978.1 PREDICTED: glucose-6-phosphate exchanger SLC37A2-like [Amphimedon queenslandica]
MRRNLAEVDRETERLIHQRPIGLDPLTINTKRISLGAWLLSYLPVISWYPRRSYQVLVFVLTFACYASYHMTRKTFSAAKSTLGPDCSTHQTGNCASDSGSQNDTGWRPFNETNCEALFGIVDNVWSFAYALFLFGSGIVAERVDLRYFLTVGMIGSAISTGMLGVAYFAKIYHLYYFLIWMAVSGIMQSTGWPGTVAVMGNWFGIKRRGFFMGVWNAHTSVGNILGTVIPAFWVEPGRPWGWAFVVPALIMLVVAMAVFFFLVVDPTDIGQTPPKHHISQSRRYRDDEKGDTGSLNHENGAIVTINEDANGFDPLGNKEHNTETKNTHKRKASVTSLAKDAGYNVLIGNDDGAIGIVKALMIPGVVEFSLALFCSKLVAYTFLFWLPYYVRNRQIGGKCLGSKESDFLSTFFDVGGIVGGITAGVISDLLNARAISCTLMLYISVPALYILHHFGNYDSAVFISLLILCGILVNGPYACITTAVSNDLGTHKDLKGNQKAKATVSAIIDGTGSVGAAIGPLLTGFISKHSWDNVFYLLMVSSFVSALLLTRLVIKEIIELYRRYCHCYTCLRYCSTD